MQPLLSRTAHAPFVATAFAPILGLDHGHGLARLKNRLDAYLKMVAFLDKYLK